MSDEDSQARAGRSTGDRRGADRRRSDRRRDDRRAPPPPWRRPWAFVAYGMVGALLIVALTGGEDEPVAEFPGDPAAAEGAAVARGSVPVEAGAPGRQAFSVEEYQRLVADGEEAVGEVVQAELYCGSIMPIALREVQGIDPRLAALADGDRRVPAAECRWSREASAAEFLLVVPPQLAADFARGPEVELNFVRRRRVPADLLWLGRSDGLALRMAGILTRVRGTER